MNITRIVSSFFLLLLIFISSKSQLFFNILLINFLSFLCFWEFFRLLNFKNLQNINKFRGCNFFLTRSKVTLIDLIQLILLQIALVFYTFDKLFFSILIFITVMFLIIFKSNHRILNFGGTVYLTIPFIAAHNFYDNQKSLLLLVLLIGVTTDIGGYLFGKSLNGPKIFPTISPNKTWAGFLGGIFLTTLVLSFFSDINLLSNYIFLSVIIFSSVICQFGDYIESFFKRFCNVKDSSNLIPGHGGVLDRIDGIVLLLTVIFILKIINFNFLENLLIF